jgi:hypothetical protein
MTAFYRRTRFLGIFLAGVFVLHLLPVAAFAEDEKIAVLNVRYEVVGELVYVYYDLKGPLDRPQKVSVTLFRESTPLFVYRPVNLTGDIGGLVFPGEKRRVVWDFTKEFPEGLIGSDYYFAVEASLIEPESSSTWLWIAGGAAVVGGVVALIILGGNESTPPPPVTGFPNPPGRP